MLKIRLSKLDFIILITIAATTLYVIANNLPKGVGSFRFFWAPVLLVAIFFVRGSMVFNNPLRLLLIYGFVSLGVLQFLLWSNMSEWNIGQFREEFYGLIAATAIWAYYSSTGKFQTHALISKWTLIFIAITLLMTHIALFIDPNLVRDSANSYQGNLTRQSLSNKFGVAGYGYAQGLILLLPSMVYLIKNHEKVYVNRVFIWSILILILILALRANVFANLLIAVPIMILAWVAGEKRSLWICLISTCSLLIFIIPSSIFSELFSGLSMYFEQGSFINIRLRDLSFFIDNPDLEAGTAVSGRLLRYPMLFEAFVDNPIFGDASYNSKWDIITGGHLFWMNKLALWGLPGFLFFLYVLYNIYKNIIKYFNKEFKYYYNLSLLAFILFGLTKNTGSREMWIILIVIIPGLYFLGKIQQTDQFGGSVNIKKSSNNAT